MNISTKGKALAAGVMAAATVGGLASTASAQTYPYQPSGYQGGYYDACARSQTNRTTGGGLAGAAIGAAIGSNIAARGVRTEGAVLGGLLGAALGAKVGRDSAACVSGQPAPYAQPAPTAQMPYGAPYSGAPYDARPYAGGYGYGYGEGDRDYDYSYSTPYGQGGYGQAYGYPVSSTPSADGCQLAESPIYLPDGRQQKRFVRVCRDASGQYQVVD